MRSDSLWPIWIGFWFNVVMIACYVYDDGLPALGTAIAGACVGVCGLLLLGRAVGLHSFIGRKP
jgi:hypothetical protein